LTLEDLLASARDLAVGNPSPTLVLLARLDPDWPESLRLGSLVAAGALLALAVGLVVRGLTREGPLN
jgi:hypothetical protein